MIRVLLITGLLMLAGCNPPKLDPSASDFCQAVEKALKETNFNFKIRTEEEWLAMHPEHQNWFLTMKEAYRTRCPKG